MKPAMETTARPPTVPPAIAPTFLLPPPPPLEGSVSVGVGVGVEGLSEVDEAGDRVAVGFSR